MSGREERSNMTRFRGLAQSLMVILLCGLLANGALAQDGKKRSRRSASSQVMTKAVATKLIAAQEMLQAGQVNGAKKELDAVMKRRGLKPLELANIYQFYAYVANEKDNPKRAIAYFTKAIQHQELLKKQSMLNRDASKGTP